MAFNGILALGSSKRYTEDTVIGMGAIKGASCTVKEYEFDPVTGDTIITFAWLDTTGVEHTEEATVKRGVQGTPGVGITSITKTGTAGLVDTYTILYSDGTTSTFTVTNGSDGGDDKLDVDQGVENAGKVMKVGADGKLTPAASSEGVEIDDTTISSGKVWSSQKTNQKIAGMIDDDSVDGVSTWSSEKISEELAGTISNDQGSENAGKTFQVGEDGGVDLVDFPNNQVQADWAQTDTTKADFIKNKPTKLSDFTNDEEFIDNTVNNLVNYYLKTETYAKAEVNDLIAAVNQFNVEFVDALPTTDIDTHTIYFVAKETVGESDAYNEYMYINNNWELIGSTEIDLSQYYTKTETDALLDDKVDKVAGKDLSANDYTDADKAIVDGVSDALDLKADKSTTYTKTETDTLLDTKQNKVIETTLADFDDAVADAEDGDLINVKDAMSGYELAITEYSTTEEVIGKWIDGKPIYRRVIEKEVRFTDTNWTDTEISANNIEQITNTVCLGTSASCHTYIAGAIVNNNIALLTTRNETFSITHIILEYTKTTD